MRRMDPMTLADAAAAPFRFSAAVLLDADIHAVFEELRDPSLWFPMMRRSVWHTGATSGVGAERIVDITGFGRFHERMLVSAAKMWKFRPAFKDGHAVRYRTWIRLTI